MADWNRVASMPMQRNLFDSIALSQRKIAETQKQMATGKKAPDHAALGTQATHNLSARSLLARHEAHQSAGSRVGNTLALMDAEIGGMAEAVGKLRDGVLEAVGTGRALGLQQAAEQAFSSFRSALNSDEAGVRLFGGSQTEQPPFLPASLAATSGLPASAAFANDDVVATARIGEGQDIAVGLTASALGTELFAAFRTLAEAGPIPEQPTPAQMDALARTVGQIDDGLKTLRAQHAETGRRQALVERLTEQAGERALVMQELVARNEDADMAEVASTLVQRQTMLEASYTVFGRLANLSLVNFLK